MSEQRVGGAPCSAEAFLRIVGLVMLLCVPLVKRLRRRLAHLRAVIAEDEARIWISAIDDQGALLAEGAIALLELAHALHPTPVPEAHASVRTRET